MTSFLQFLAFNCSVNVNAGDVLKEHRISLINPDNQGFNWQYVADTYLKMPSKEWCASKIPAGIYKSL